MNHIKPGNWVKITKDGEHLKCDDSGIVFPIERGAVPEYYCVFCYDKMIWEYLTREQIK